MMLERQSTTVPNTSKANARGIIVCSSRKRSSLSRLQHDLPEHPTVGQALQGLGALRQREPHRRRRPQACLDQLGDTGPEQRLGAGVRLTNSP